MTPVENKLHTNSPPRPDKPLRRSATIRTQQAFYEALRGGDSNVIEPKDKK